MQCVRGGELVPDSSPNRGATDMWDERRPYPCRPIHFKQRCTEKIVSCPGGKRARGGRWPDELVLIVNRGTNEAGR